MKIKLKLYSVVRPWTHETTTIRQAWQQKHPQKHNQHHYRKTHQKIAYISWLTQSHIFYAYILVAIIIVIFIQFLSSLAIWVSTITAIIAIFNSFFHAVCPIVVIIQFTDPTILICSSWFIKIISRKVCVCIYMYLPIFVHTHWPTWANHSCGKNSPYTRNIG